MDVISAWIDRLEKFKSRELKAYTIYFYLANVYPTVDPEVLQQILGVLGMSPADWRLIASLYDRALFAMRAPFGPHGGNHFARWCLPRLCIELCLV